MLSIATTLNYTVSAILFFPPFFFTCDHTLHSVQKCVYTVCSENKERMLFKSGAAKTFTAACAQGYALERCQSHLYVDNIFHWNKTKPSNQISFWLWHATQHNVSYIMGITKKKAQTGTKYFLSLWIIQLFAILEYLNSIYPACTLCRYITGSCIRNNK